MVNHLIMVALLGALVAVTAAGDDPQVQEQVKKHVKIEARVLNPRVPVHYPLIMAVRMVSDGSSFQIWEDHGHVYDWLHPAGIVLYEGRERNFNLVGNRWHSSHRQGLGLAHHRPPPFTGDKLVPYQFVTPPRGFNVSDFVAGNVVFVADRGPAVLDTPGTYHVGVRYRGIVTSNLVKVEVLPAGNASDQALGEDPDFQTAMARCVHLPLTGRDPGWFVDRRELLDKQNRFYSKHADRAATLKPLLLLCEAIGLMHRSSDQDLVIAAYKKALAHLRVGDPLREHCLFYAVIYFRHCQKKNPGKQLEPLIKECEDALVNESPDSLYTAKMLAKHYDLTYGVPTMKQPNYWPPVKHLLPPGKGRDGGPR